jgi:IS30 family transposase
MQLCGLPPVAQVAGHSVHSIADSLGRGRSTVSREVKRNGGLQGYRASQIGQTAWYRGKEMSDHKRFTLATDISVYFCDPHSSWKQREYEWTVETVFPQGDGHF